MAQFPDFFVFRTAALPFDDFLAWGKDLAAPRSLNDPDRLAEALRQDRQELRARLNAIAARPDVREALYVASVELEGALQKWARDPDSKKGKRLERSLVRYFARMCGRATPFGLFAGHSVGTRGENTRLEIQSQAHYRRHVRLDMDYLSSLTEALAADEKLQSILTYRPNSSIHRSAGRLRYAESRFNTKTRSYHLVAVDETDYLLDTFQRAESGATVRELAEPLVGDGVALEDAIGYVRALVASQLLVPDLNARATGSEPMQDLIAQLRSHAETVAVANRLEEVHGDLDAMERQPPGLPADHYKAIAAKLEELPAKVEVGALFQVDLSKPASHAALTDDVLAEMARAAKLLHGLRPEADEDLAAFRDAFRTRYENREVPLFDVLDEESGIGFGGTRSGSDATPLIDGLAVPRAGGQPRQAASSGASFSPLDAYLIDKLQDAYATKELVLSLDAEELDRLRVAKPKPLPEAISVVAKLAARSAAALDRGEFNVLVSFLLGPSGALLFGRFCHDDPQLREHVQQQLALEESVRPDVVYAEIVHLPEGRAGNVILRPQFRQYEIPFLGRSAVPEEHQLPVSDLMVSLKGDAVVLRSKKLGKEVVPRLTCAHNFRLSGLSIYRFLCSLQTQGTARMLGWSWGTLEKARFLPRVVVGKLVLSRARWRVDKDELQSLFDPDWSDAQRYQFVHDWRARRHIPRLVVLVDGDNQLPFDLENLLSLETFLDVLKKRRDARLDELYPGPEELCATGPEGRFVHELVVPLMLAEPGNVLAQTKAVRPQAKPETPTIRRSFPPGSEWLYAKLYTGTAGADQLLREVVAPLVTRSLQSGSADRWFFIRYSDPDWHVRLRLHGDPARLFGDVLPELSRLCDPLLDNGLLWKMQLDTYEREIERYGGAEAIVLAEALFQIDSESTLQVLERCDAESLADDRWRLAIRGMDQLLDDLGFGINAKYELLFNTREAARTELNARQLEFQIGERFRRERRALETLLDRDRDASSNVKRALAVFDHRSERIRPIAQKLRQLAEQRALTAPLEAIAGSYLHMHANRILRSAHQAQEIVLYDFLTRIYESRRARQHQLQEAPV